MNDYSELKQAAEDYRDRPGETHFEALAAAASAEPGGVLDLLAELEHLRSAMLWRDRALKLMNHAFGFLPEDDADTMASKAQAIRANADRYQWLRQKSFERDYFVFNRARTASPAAEDLDIAIDNDRRERGHGPEI